MSALMQAPVSTVGIEHQLADSGAQIRVGELRGAAALDPRGVRLRVDPFYGGELPAAGQVVEVEWRDSHDRFVAFAPVVERGRGTLVLGAFRWARPLEPLARLDWNLLVVTARNGKPCEALYRVARADDDRLHVVLPSRAHLRPGDLLQGRIRRPDGRALRVLVQVRAVPDGWTTSGHRIAVARWRRA